MNILYCGDEYIEKGLIISILSLLKNVKDKLHIYVLTMDLETENRKFAAVSNTTIEILNNRVKEKNKNNFVKKIDISKMFNSDIPTKNMGTRFTPYCMLRLYADKIKGLPPKILYLDTDVICRKDITEFYNQDVTKYELIGVLDHYGKWFFKNNIFKMDYINSGVLLLNLSMIRKTKLFARCRKMCKEKEMFMPDQSAINKLATSKKIVSRKYNEQRKLQQDTYLQHFTTSFRFFPWFHSLTVKPWQIDKLHSELKITEYDDIIEEYEQIMSNIDLVRRKEK